MNSQEIPFLDLVAQNASVKAELLQVFTDAAENAQFVGGKQVADFEEEFASYTTARFAIGVANGTDALRLALIAMGIKPGSHVVTVPNTFIATTEAISQCGGMIDFVDIEPDTCLMDANKLEDYLAEAFNKKPKENRPVAVVPVHLYGQCVDMDAILSLAKKYELQVLEDAAQAHGATHRGKSAGSMGDAAGFSFYPGKNLGALGEAGGVTTNSEVIANAVRVLRDHGQRTKYYHQVEGCNARLDAIQAGFLRVKLRHLPQWNAARQKIAAFYDAQLAAIDWLTPVRVLPHNVSSHHLYVVQVAQRDALQQHMKQMGVATGLHYPVPLHLQECYQSMALGTGSFPNAEKSAAELISLPMFPELGLERAQQVIDAIISFRG